jgi:hypothetical protein
MSLNSCEQRIFDYLREHPDEDRFWREKVRVAAGQPGEEAAIAARLERDLWRYYEERSGSVPALREVVRHEGLRRTSMRNLAELLLRLWTDPRPKKKSPPGADAAHDML